MASFKDSFWGLQGFEELRKYIKQGNEFCREVAAIMQERSELENTYAKGLAKLSTKLNKACSNCLGTMVSAWSSAATELEAESEVHRSLGSSLHEEISKPMKTLAELQYKTRKPVETMVNKSATALLDKRNDELKTRRNAFASAKESEKINENVQSAKSGRGKQVSEKDIAKLEKKSRNAVTSMTKTDSDYHEICLKAEISRQEWESAVYKGSAQMQKIEEERLQQMHELLKKYHSNVSEVGPKYVQSCNRLQESVMTVDVHRDLATVVEQKGTGPNQPEQILFECYAEDFNNNMNNDRRRKALTNYLLYLQQDIEREKKGREGIEKLLDVYQNTPNFADQEALDDSRQKMININAMLNFLEASYYKISCALAQLNGKPIPQHKFSQYIEQVRDKQGITQSVLRLPLAMVLEGAPDTDYGILSDARGLADGGHDGAHSYQEPKYNSEYHSNRPDSFDEDEFDTMDYGSMQAVACRCEAIYDYEANQSDELTIRPGDVINVYYQQDDGWWQGELNGKVGIFPATYVQVIE